MMARPKSMSSATGVFCLAWALACGVLAVVLQEWLYMFGVASGIIYGVLLLAGARRR